MILIAIAITVAPLPTTDLTPTIGFADARACRLVPEGERIISRMRRAARDAGTGEALLNNQALRRLHPWMGMLIGGDLITRVVDTGTSGDTDRGTLIRLSPGSVLHGLPVTSIRFRFQQTAESDGYTSREIVFAASPARVHAMMDRLGAKVPPMPGYLTMADADDMEPGAITIKGSGSTTTLTCGWGL